MDIYEKELIIKDLSTNELLYKLEEWARGRAPSSAMITMATSNNLMAKLPVRLENRRFHVTLKTLELTVG